MKWLTFYQVYYDRQEETNHDGKQDHFGNNLWQGKTDTMCQLQMIRFMRQDPLCLVPHHNLRQNEQRLNTTNHSSLSGES